MKPQASKSAAPESFIRCNSALSPTLLLIGAGRRPYREYALRALAARYRVVLLDSNPPTWAKAYAVGCWAADLRDVVATRGAISAICAEHTVHGVLTWDEFAAVPAARLARDLGLPGADPGAVARARSKAALRTALDVLGVPSAAWHFVTQLAHARAAAVRIGYPVVLKPAAGGGSMGVIRVDRPADLADAFDFTRRFCDGGGMLVEEYLDGPEVSAEVVSTGSRHQVVAVTTKELGPAPYFEETGHLVDGAADPSHPATVPVAAVATAALKALGIGRGVSHVELRLTGSGPRIIEVNPRIGGDLIGHLVHLATGVDLTAAAGDLAAGRAPDLTPTRRQAAGIHFAYPRHAGRVHGITVEAGLAAAPWCERAVITQPAGAHVAPPPAGGLDSRLAHIVVVGSSAAQCRERLDQAAAAVHTDIRPGPERRS